VFNEFASAPSTHRNANNVLVRITGEPERTGAQGTPDTSEECSQGCGAGEIANGSHAKPLVCILNRVDVVGNLFIRMCAPHGIDYNRKPITVDNHFQPYFGDAFYNVPVPDGRRGIGIPLKGSCSLTAK
jgi:hypothetical protein